MNLKQLIYKRLVHAKDIGGLLAKYAGHPAVFDTEAPDDKQDGWEGKTQYPRLNIVLDMQANEERSSVGSLTITIYTERTSMVILEIESLVKTCFRAVSYTHLFPIFGGYCTITSSSLAVVTNPFSPFSHVLCFA